MRRSVCDFRCHGAAGRCTWRVPKKQVLRPGCETPLPRAGFFKERRLVTADFSSPRSQTAAPWLAAALHTARLLALFQFFQQISLQVPAGGLLDRAPLRGHPLFLRLPFLPRARFDRAGQMGNLRPLHTDLSFVRLGVGVHSSLNDLAIERFGEWKTVRRGQPKDFRGFAGFGSITSRLSKTRSS